MWSKFYTKRGEKGGEGTATDIGGGGGEREREGEGGKGLTSRRKFSGMIQPVLFCYHWTINFNHSTVSSSLGSPSNYKYSTNCNLMKAPL